ncbi:MAG TPA: SRPBCC family protein [Longimicrobiaceae bacterium]|nr:SRPBCC family protein [Longimicrobiaceae bacterium]
MSQNEPRSYDVQVDAPPEEVWRALTDPELTQQYYFNTRVESDWTRGSPVRYRNPEGGVDLEGEVLEFDPPRRLTTTFRPTWAPEVAGTPPSTVTWAVEPSGSGSRLTLTHKGFDWSSPGADSIHGAWQHTVSGLKSVVEGRSP